MSIGRPDSAQHVEDRMKADVARSAPDSNPYLRVHWLRSLIASIARRIFDFYGDLARTESRLFPDTADDETSLIWGNIYVGPKNPASPASGNAVATGTAGSTIPPGTLLSSNGVTYETTSGATISANSVSVASITLAGTTGTVTTSSPHGLSSSVPVTIAGAVESEYNVTDAAIVVTGENTFTYDVTGSPSSPATGTISASYTSASVPIESQSFGSDTNLDLDTPVKLQSPIAGVDDTLAVDYGQIGGGTDEETTDDYKDRYLEKIKDPVAHFSASEIKAKAKEVAGVTRVFVEEAGTVIGSQAVTSITRSGNVAKVTTAAPHGYDDGQVATITGADQAEYNVIDARVLVEDSTTFHYVVTGAPASPATGTITASVSISVGQVRTFFMRDNDPDPIPAASEVALVKAALDSIRPANTLSYDNIVKAPTAVPVNYTFTNIFPDTSTMRSAISASIAQFHEEQTTVGMGIDEDAYRSAIKSTVDPSTGENLQTFTLSVPIGDITINSGEIATEGDIIFP